MYCLLNIPTHSNCKNCGECCGIVLLTASEQNKIDKYVLGSPRAQEVKRIAKKDPMTCVYRDEENNNCSIYDVRPLICRLFGVTKGMECVYGNSHEIDADKFFGSTSIEDLDLIK